MKKRFLSLALIIVLGTTMTACGQKTAGTTEPVEEAEPAKAEEAEAEPEAEAEAGALELTEAASISLAANPIGQSSYEQAAAIADMINNSGSLLNVTAEATNGYAENVGLVAEGDVEIAFTNNLMLSDGYYAAGDYTGITPEKCLGVISLSCNKTHVIVRADSDITEVSHDQFMGKRIGIGQVGGTSRTDALNLMAALGLEPSDYDGYEVKGAEQTEMMKNGQLDVFIWNGKAPIATVLDLVSSIDCRFLEIPEDIVDVIIENSNGAYSEQYLFADYYECLEEDVYTYGNNAVLFANADVPEEVVYEFTKLFVENLEELAKVNKSFGEIKPETMLQGISVPLHPGALRYYQEIGVPGIEAFE